MKFLFVADPLDRLKPASDSSFALVRAAMQRGHEVYWALAQDVEYVGDGVAVNATKILDCGPATLPLVDDPSWTSLISMDAVFIRKDPPFDNSYVKLCWLLALADNKVWMLNRPALLLRYHEKMIPLEARAKGFLLKDDIIPTHIGTLPRAREFAKFLNAPQVISKPFLGFGGSHVMKHDIAKFATWRPDNDDLVVQPFKKEIINQGDRRVFFLDGNLLAHFVRRPPSGGFISNLAQGGSALSEPMTPKETEVCDRLGKFLKAAGITLAGADLIGGQVSEVNITSPTGLRALEKLEGREYAVDIIEFAELSINARKEKTPKPVPTV